MVVILYHMPITTVCQHISENIDPKFDCNPPLAPNRTPNRTPIRTQIRASGRTLIKAKMYCGQKKCLKRVRCLKILF
jgi:hypothetical protein